MNILIEKYKLADKKIGIWSSGVSMQIFKTNSNTMKKKFHCNCKTGCGNRRCNCLKNNEPCGEACGCIDCQNPLNDVDVAALSVCAIQNIEIYKELTEKELETEYELPCGDESVPLKDQAEQ